MAYINNFEGFYIYPEFASNQTITLVPGGITVQDAADQLNKVQSVTADEATEAMQCMSAAMQIQNQFDKLGLGETLLAAETFEPNKIWDSATQTWRNQQEFEKEQSELQQELNEFCTPLELEIINEEVGFIYSRNHYNKAIKLINNVRRKVSYKLV